MWEPGSCLTGLRAAQSEDLPSSAGELQSKLAKFLIRCPNGIVMVTDLQSMPSSVLSVFNNALSEAVCAALPAAVVHMRHMWHLHRASRHQTPPLSCSSSVLVTGTTNALRKCAHCAAPWWQHLPHWQSLCVTM